MRLLGSSNPYEGVERLSQLVERLGDTREATVIRAALGVGVDRLKNTAQRRDAVEKKLVISESARWRAERKGLDALARLILDEHRKREEGDIASLEKIEIQKHADGPPEDRHWLQSAREYLRANGLAGVIGIGICIGVLYALNSWMSGDYASSPSSTSTGLPILPKVTAFLPSKMPKIAAFTSSSSAPDSSSGWGPSRRTFTVEHPAPFVAFNAFTNFPQFGDERSFVQCHDKRDTAWSTRVTAHDGQSYECLIWFDNAVATNMGMVNQAAQLQNARALIQLPKGGGINPSVVGLLSADNSSTVWASCTFLSQQPVMLSYDVGTARMYTYETPSDGLALAETYNGDAVIQGITISPGALLGDAHQDGHVQQYPGYVIFDITAHK
jgi:hypothetical protein